MVNLFTDVIYFSASLVSPEQESTLWLLLSMAKNTRCTLQAVTTIADFGRIPRLYNIHCTYVVGLLGPSFQEKDHGAP